MLKTTPQCLEPLTRSSLAVLKQAFRFNGNLMILFELNLVKGFAMFNFVFPTRKLVIILLGLILALPASAQNFPFPGNGQRGLGVGDVLSVLGTMDRSNPRMGRVGQQRSARDQNLATVIQVGTILYHASRQGAPVRTETPHPTRVPVAYPQPQPTHSHGQPAGYNAITRGGQLIRLDPQTLPLTINPGSQRYAEITHAAVQTWNQAGLGQVFALTNGPADITVDWAGHGVSPGARAETRMASSHHAMVPTGISVRTQGRSAHDLARVMVHELGHVMGLDHSNDPNDIMFRAERPGPLALSSRDRQMITWLYSQPNYTPIVGQTKLNSGAVLARNLQSSEQSYSSPNSESVCSFHEH